MATINGNANPNTLNGGINDDTLYGKAGDDTLYGRAGMDILYGDEGADILYGGIGADTLYGGIGDDILYGEAGDDILNGGSGNDFILGGTGKDQFVFNSGKEFTPADLGLDEVSGFTRGQDKIFLSKTTFTGIDSNVGNGFSQANEYAVVEDVEPNTILVLGTFGVNVIFNKGNNGLYYLKDNPVPGIDQPNQFATFEDVISPPQNQDFNII